MEHKGGWGGGELTIGTTSLSSSISSVQYHPFKGAHTATQQLVGLATLLPPYKDGGERHTCD